MADLDEVLIGLGNQGATLLKGTVSAVSTGLLTVQVNGDVFQRVPYLKGGWTPVAGEQVYLLSQKNFGTLALGSPAATTPPVADPAPTVTVVDPTTVSNWQVPQTSGMVQAEDGSWVSASFYAVGKWVDLTGDLVQTAPNVSTGVWFYSAAALAAVTFPLASVTMELLLEVGTQVDLVLHANTGPTGDFINLPATGTHGVKPKLNTVTQVPIPLDWAKRLIAGSAKGIAARSKTRNAQLFAHGTLTFTSL